MKNLLAILFSAVTAAVASAAPQTVDVSFARGKWNPADFEYVKSWRFDFFNTFEQTDEGVVNLLAPEMSPLDVFKKRNAESYVAMLHKGTFPVGTTVSSTMMWDYRMAPIIVLADTLGVSTNGVPELRNHWEVCLYDEGINVWYHFFEDGRQKWYKAADYLAPKDRPFKANVRHELIVKTEKNSWGHRRMVVTCGDVTFAYVDDKLPATFRAGIIGCEGRNWFYDFKARTK